MWKLGSSSPAGKFRQPALRQAAKPLAVIYNTDRTMSKQRTERERLLNLENKKPFRNYTIISKNDTSNKYAKPLGEGGSGIVYLAEQEFVDSIKVKRAIKYFVFRDDIAKDHETSGRISSQNFNDEIINISSFNHENILKIIDGGIERKKKEDIPFIVTEYIDGDSLDKFVKDPSLGSEYIANGEDIINIFGQICTGLKFLHSNHFYHCDIAPKNIFIKGSKGNFQIIIGDLGVGKTLLQSITKGKLFVLGSRKYMPENVLAVVNQEIEYTDFCKLQPAWDIYSLKRTFDELLNAFQEYLKDDANSTWFKSLKKLIAKSYENVSDIAKNIERIKPIYRQTAGIPELSEADSTLHGHYELHPIKSVWITDRIKKVIRHPLYSRLKKVPQLLSSNTFNPGSTHTRYEHSLGTYENMRKVLMTLLRNEDFLEFLDESKLELALVASLLSSISKYPYSFVINEIRERDPALFSKFEVRKYIEEILNYKNHDKNIDYSLNDVLKKEFKIHDTNELIEIIKGNTDSKWNKDIKIISKLLNSTIDVRVLDFLPRDSYHLGISTGAHIDFDGLVSNICMHDGYFSVKSRGITYIEQVVTLRYWLYKRIYLNSPNRAYTCLFKHIFIKLESELDEFEDDFFKETIFADKNHILKFLDTKLSGTENLKPIHDLLKTIYADRPVIFKEIFVINQTESMAELNQICNKFSKLPYSKLDEIRIELEKDLGSILDFEKNTINILIDIPNDDNKKLGEDITIIKYDGQPVALSKLSGLIQGISSTFNDNLKFLRVYLNPKYKDQLRQPNKRKDVHNRILTFLKEHT
ncbi:protein kinase [Odoribacter sp. OttesenSCG-928-L07]|nr:protein kinase [Odoribacter sp. OttesenSCG-928-L07]